MLCDFTAGVSAVSFGNVPHAQGIGQNMCESPSIGGPACHKLKHDLGSETRGV